MPQSQQHTSEGVASVLVKITHKKKMSELREAFTAQGLEGIKRKLHESKEEEKKLALNWLYCALLCYSKGDISGAKECSFEAHRIDPNNKLYFYCHEHFSSQREGGQGQKVYESGKAFKLFVSKGGNVPLYENLSALLKTEYNKSTTETLNLLDIGVGGGAALIPALETTQEAILQQMKLSIIEPSSQMMSETLELITSKLKITPVKSFIGTVQNFIRQQEQQSADKIYDITQATFSLQNISPHERPPIFQWIKAHSKKVLIAEFDADPMWMIDPLNPICTEKVIKLYENGINEYSNDDQELVSRGFLVPVLLGGVTITKETRTNFEGPISDWINELLKVGFVDVHIQFIHSYWWANGYLITAQ